MKCAKRTITGALVSAGVCVALSGCAALGVGAAGGAAGGAVESRKAEDAGKQYSAGTYVGTVLANTVYVPAKIIFAGAGAATSGVAYLVSLGNRDVSGRIWDSSVGGDYVVTPRMISGGEQVDFVGKRSVG